MKHIKLYEKFVGDNSVKAFFNHFTTSYRSANLNRYLPDESDRNMICDYLEEQIPNDFPIYRACYEDYGNIGKTEIGHIAYEPLMSCSSDRNICESMLRKRIDNDRISKVKAQPMLLVIEKGAKSADIDEISTFIGQKEYVVAGKFKVKSRKHYTLTIKNYKEDIYDVDVLEVTVQQLHDEPFIDIFNKMSNVKQPNRETKTEVSMEELVMDRYHKYCKLTLQKPEILRIEAKGIKIDDEYLSNLISKRIYHNVSVGLTNLSYETFYDIMKRNNFKIYGGKKFGYPELDFVKKLKL